MDWVKLNLEEQMKYAKSEEEDVRVAFSRYPVLPEVADYMVAHEMNEWAMGLIFLNLFRTANNNVWASTLSKAARRKVEICGVYEIDTVLSGIALHLNTDVDTLEYLFELNNTHINWALASNTNTPRVILEKLSNEEKFDILEALYFNPNVPEEIKTKVRKRLPETFFSVGSYYETIGIEIKASGN